MADCMRNTDLFCKECGTYRHCFASDDDRPDRLVPRVERLASDAAKMYSHPTSIDDVDFATLQQKTPWIKRDGVWEMPR